MINIRTKEGVFTPKFHTFSGGEEHVNISHINLKLDKNDDITIECRINSSQELIRLILVADAINLETNYKNYLQILIPYFPYARQDRKCQPGDSFSLAAMINIFGTISADEICIADPHSAETSKLLRRYCEYINIVPQNYFVPYVQSRIPDVDYIISPDLGARDKSKIWLDRWNVSSEKKAELVCATKKRNEVGQIIATELLDEVRPGTTALIVDDIADYGGTFKELSRLLRSKGVEKVYLFVTHGIFAAGTDVVECDKVFTTDSFEEKEDGRNVVYRFFYK